MVLGHYVVSWDRSEEESFVFVDLRTHVPRGPVRA